MTRVGDGTAGVRAGGGRESLQGASPEQGPRDSTDGGAGSQRGGSVTPE